jgi:hypothetical protein
MTNPIAYATAGIDGDITMLWLPDQLAEARTYCAEGEEPIPLGRLMTPLTDEQALKAWTRETGIRLKPGPTRDEVLQVFRMAERAHGITS